MVEGFSVKGNPEPPLHAHEFFKYICKFRRKFAPERLASIQMGFRV